MLWSHFQGYSSRLANIYLPRCDASKAELRRFKIRKESSNIDGWCSTLSFSNKKGQPFSSSEHGFTSRLFLFTSTFVETSDDDSRRTIFVFISRSRFGSIRRWRHHFLGGGYLFDLIVRRKVLNIHILPYIKRLNAFIHSKPEVVLVSFLSFRFPALSTRKPLSFRSAL